MKKLLCGLPLERWLKENLYAEDVQRAGQEIVSMLETLGNESRLAEYIGTVSGSERMMLDPSGLDLLKSFVRDRGYKFRKEHNFKPQNETPVKSARENDILSLTRFSLTYLVNTTAGEARRIIEKNTAGLPKDSYVLIGKIRSGIRKKKIGEMVGFFRALGVRIADREDIPAIAPAQEKLITKQEPIYKTSREILEGVVPSEALKDISAHVDLHHQKDSYLAKISKLNSSPKGSVRVYPCEDKEVVYRLYLIAERRREILGLPKRKD